MWVNQVFHNKRALVLTISLALSLNACGGGSGGSGSGGSGNPDTTLEGTTAKGIIKHGLVKAHELDVNGGDKGLVGETTTDDQGNYKLVLDENYQGGPIKVTVVPQEGATMVCDVHNIPDCPFGESISLPNDFAMNAVLGPVVKGKSVEVQITPLTHMAAARVLGSGNSVDKRAIEAAISEVNQIAGVNIIAVRPADITSAEAKGKASKDEKDYAAFIAGIGKVVFSAEGGLSKGLADLAESFEDGKLDGNDKIHATQIVEEVRAESQASDIDVSGKLAAIEARIDNNGNFDPKPLNASETDIKRAQSLISEVRAWFTSLDKMKASAKEFSGDIELVSQVFNKQATMLTDQFALILDAVVAELDGVSQDNLIGEHTVMFDGVDIPVTVSRTDDNGDGLNITIAETQIGDSKVALNIDTNIPDSVVGGSQSSSISKVDMRVSGLLNGTNTTLKLDNFHFVINTGTAIDVTAQNAPENPDITDATLEGKMTLTQEDKDGTRYSFVGDSGLEFVKLAGQGASTQGPNLSLKRVVLNGDLSASDNRSLSGKVELNVSNAKDFDTLGFGDGDFEETSNNFMKASITVTLDLALSGFPDSKVVLSGARNGFKAGSVSFTAIRDDVTRFTVETSYAGGPDLDVDVSNPDGAKMTVHGNENDVTGSIRVNGHEVGTVTPHNGVTYILWGNGDFDSLQ